VAGYSFGILNDAAEWGVSAHFMDENIDTGDLIRVDRFPICAKLETAFSLERKTQTRLVRLFVEVIDDVVAGHDLPRVPQPNLGHRFTKSDLEQSRRIGMGDTADIIDRKIRAFWFPPFPGAVIDLAGTSYTVVGDAVLDEVGQAYRTCQE
jgi:methionyl-tRNA formyltransferase